jgi:co-chaperonin GroES (HSP10)
MRSMVRAVLVVLAAVSALSAVGVSTASASRAWQLEGSVLAVGKAKELKVVKNTTFDLTSGTEVYTCERVALEAGNKIENTTLEGAGAIGRDSGTIAFSKCKDQTKPGCVVTEPLSMKGVESALVENTARTKIYDMWTGEGWQELTPKEVAEKGQVAAKEQAEKRRAFAIFKQTGSGCISTTTIEGDGLAAEVSPEGESVKKTITLPCPPVSLVDFGNGINEVSLPRLTWFGVKATLCGSMEVELSTKEKFGVK